MPDRRLRRHVPLLVLLYSGLALAWGWRLHSQETAEPVDEVVQRTRVTLAKRIARLPQRRMQPALFQLGMLPEDEVRGLAAWLDQAPILRLRQVTVQSGPVHAPSPVNDALLLAEMSRPDAPSVEEIRLLVAAAGERVTEEVKVEALRMLASAALDDDDPSQALEVLVRACDSPAAGWEEVLALSEAARQAHRPAAALRVVSLWLNGDDKRFNAAQRDEALDLQCTLLLEGGRHAEASRVCLDALRSLADTQPVPVVMMERALRATEAAGESAELLPWIERLLRTHREHAASWQQLAEGHLTGEEYRRWLLHAARIADGQGMSGTACDSFFRVAAAGDLHVLGRLHALAEQVGQQKELDRLLGLLQSRDKNPVGVIELARALAAGGASSAAHDRLVAHLQKHPVDRDAAFALADIDQEMRGPGGAVMVWEGFLKRFPADVPALRRLADLQIQSGQHAQALRSLQRIPEDKLDESSARQMAALGGHLDDVAATHHALQWIVTRQKQPAVSDLMALAAVSSQHDDPAAADETLRMATSRSVPGTFLARWTQRQPREATAEPFATAAEQVRPAIAVEE
jgi:tetratricopeptide (TPR) repeat protein